MPNFRSDKVTKGKTAAAARSLWQAGGVPREFNTIAIDDGIAMGHDGITGRPGLATRGRAHPGDNPRVESLRGFRHQCGPWGVQENLMTVSLRYRRLPQANGPTRLAASCKHLSQVVPMAQVVSASSRMAWILPLSSMEVKNSLPAATSSGFLSRSNEVAFITSFQANHNCVRDKPSTGNAPRLFSRKPRQ